MDEQRRKKIDLVLTFTRYHTYQQCCGSGINIPDPNFFPPGSWIHGQKDSGSLMRIGIRIKKISILTQEKFSELSEISKIFIPDSDPGSGSTGQTGNGSRIRIRNTANGTYLAGEELVVAVGEAGEPGPDFLSLAGLLPQVVHCLAEV